MGVDEPGGRLTAFQVEVARLSDELAGKLGTELNQLITRVELTATRERCHTLLKTGLFPFASDDWPAIPWPAF